MRVVRTIVVIALALGALVAGAPGAAAAPAAPDGAYYPITPTRVLDTRIGLGAPTSPLLPATTTTLPIAGVGGIPATGVAAVVLNVTVTDPSAFGYLTVFPSAAARPTASSLNFNPHQTVANSVTVGLGSSGAIDLFNSEGATDAIVDVVGYYANSSLPIAQYGAGSQFRTLTPTRIFDTRDADQGPALGPDEGFALPIDFGVDNAHVSAVAVNITAVTPSAPGYLTTWDGQADFPQTSTVNFTAGTTVPNFAIIPTAPCTATASCAGLPAIGIFNGSTGNTHVVIDLVGFYDNDPTITDGLLFHPITPERIVDSRIGLGAHTLGPQSTARITTPASIGDADTVVLSLNVTAVVPTANTYLSVWPDDLAQPLVSSLNPLAGQTVPNAVVTGFDSHGTFDVYNNAGTTALVIDVNGYFDSSG